MSLPSCLTLRTVKGSVLSWVELDNNFICLNNSINNVASLIHNGNMWHIPSGNTVTIETDYQYFIYGDMVIEGTLQLSGGSQLVVLNGDLIFSGGSVVGNGDIYNITLPDFDTKISGLTYSGNVLTIYQNDGSTYSTTIVSSTDITVTGGTYNPTTGTATFYDNNGGNFDVNGFLTGYTDVQVSGLTYSGDTLTLTQTDGSNFNVTINSSTPFTGNTSGDCITDLYVTNLNSCSPLHIQPVNTGDVYISENGGNVGIGTSSPTSNLHIKGIDSTSSNYGLKVQNSGGTNTLQVRNDGLVEFGDTSQPYNTWLQYTGGTLKLNYNTTSNFYWNGSDLQLTGLNGNGNSKLEFTSITARQQTLIRSYNTEKLSFATNGGNANMQLSSNGDLYIGNDTSTGVTATSRLEVRGSGTTSSGYGLKVQDSLGTDNFVVRNDGNVGIGTSSPSEKLEVSGNTKLTSLSNVFKISSHTALGMSQGVGAANVFIGGGTVTDGTNGGGISIGSSSTTYGDGVSIGQTAKADSSGGDAIAIGRNSTANGSVRSIAIGRNSTSSASNAWALGYNTNATQDNTFIFGDSSDINIKSGFGTNTPEARIHIKGSDSTSSNYGLKVQNSGGTDNLVVRNDGNVGIGTSNPTQKLHILSYGTGGVLAQLNDAPFNVDLSGSYGQLKFTYGSDIEFSINPYPTAFNTSFRFKSNPAGVSGENGIEHSVIGVINGNGGLVIGESLNIGSTSAYTGTYHSGTIYGKRIQKSNFNNPNATFYPLIVMDGNVGIGTSTPTNGKLEVVGGSSQGVIATSTNDIAVNGTSTGASSFGIKGESDLGTSIRSNVTNTSAIGLEVNYTPTNSSLFKVLGDGNVGIGTSTPSEKLDVSGKTKTDSLQIYNPYIPTGSTDPTGSIGDISLSGDVLFWRDSTQWYRISGQTW